MAEEAVPGYRFQANAEARHILAGVRRLIAVIAVVPLMVACGDEPAPFSDSERSEVRKACLEQYGKAQQRFCDCSVDALESADAANMRDDRASFIEEHLTGRTIRRCS